MPTFEQFEQPAVGEFNAAEMRLGLIQRAVSIARGVLAESLGKSEQIVPQPHAAAISPSAIADAQALVDNTYQEVADAA